MKLYATVTSERASKGQGGEYLIVTIYGENKNELYIITMKGDTLRVAEAESGKVIFKDTKGEKCLNGGTHRWHKPYINECIMQCCMCDKVQEETKGEKQKGELCEVCKHGHNGQKCSTKGCICSLCNR